MYVWSVTHNHVVDSSLGYYINPLMNVVLGVFVLRERLNRAQWLAVALAAIAVAYLTVLPGRAPWIALALAITFSLYGLLRKVISVDALPGLATETLLLMPLAAAYLGWCELTGSGALTRAPATVAALLIGSGLATAIPLFLFAYGARTLPYSTVGLLQYIGPSLQVSTRTAAALVTAQERMRAVTGGGPPPAHAPRGYCLPREMYSPVRVSTRITSPSLMKRGTRTTAPVSSLAGF